MIGIALLVLGGAAAGAWSEARWGGVASVWARRALLASLYAVFPAVIFLNLARVEVGGELLGGIGLGWVAIWTAGLVAWRIGASVLQLAPPEVGSMIVSTLVGNSGILGFPLVIALFGADRLGEAVAYDTLVSLPALLIGGMATGAAMGTSAGEGLGQRTRAFLARNPPLYAAIAALIAPASLAPGVLVDASQVAVLAMLPVAFFAVGTALAEESEEGLARMPPPLGPPVASVIVTRMVIPPTLLFLLSTLLVDVPDVWLVLAAMPCGINLMLVAHAFGLGVRIAAEALAWTTAIGLAVAVAASLVV